MGVSVPFTKNKQGSCQTLVCAEQSAMAYKPISEILDGIANTVEVIDVMNPVYNFKAH